MTKKQQHECGASQCQWWLTEEHGNDDEVTAADRWSVDCLGQAVAAEKALDSLLAHGMVEGMKRADARNFKFVTTRWRKGCRMKDGEWKMKVRFVAREYKLVEHREDLVSPGAMDE